MSETLWWIIGIIGAIVAIGVGTWIFAGTRYFRRS